MTPGSARVRGVLAAIAAIAATPVTGRTDPAAEQLFRDGRQLLQDGKIAAACERFHRSQALEPKVGTLLNLADCRERAGQLAQAWADFLEAKALAARQRDPRAGEAARRAAAIEPRLAYLTIEVAPAARVAGLTITRAGVAVALAAWSTPVPVDPGTYRVEATAPGHRPWTATTTLAAGARGTTVMSPLVADPDPPIARPGDAAAPAVTATALAAPRAPLRRLGFGVAVGASSDDDLIGGVRAIGGLPAPGGAVRGTVSVQYTRYDATHLVATGLGLDYVLVWRAQLASALGGGVGVDRGFVSGDDNWTSSWYQLRASPLIVQLGAPPLELGLHVQYYPTPRIVIGIVAIDWFVW